MGSRRSSRRRVSSEENDEAEAIAAAVSRVKRPILDKKNAAVSAEQQRAAEELMREEEARSKRERYYVPLEQLPNLSNIGYISSVFNPNNNPLPSVAPNRHSASISGAKVQFGRTVQNSIGWQQRPLTVRPASASSPGTSPYPSTAVRFLPAPPPAPPPVRKRTWHKKESVMEDEATRARRRKLARPIPGEMTTTMMLMSMAPIHSQQLGSYRDNVANPDVTADQNLATIHSLREAYSSILDANNRTYTQADGTVTRGKGKQPRKSNTSSDLHSKFSTFKVPHVSNRLGDRIGRDNKKEKKLNIQPQFNTFYEDKCDQAS